MEKFFEQYFKGKQQRPRELLYDLYQTPKKDKGANMPKFQVLMPNYIHQMDLLTMPNDDGYRYMLVVVDANSKLTDAEPLKTKNSNEITQALKKIHKRKILGIPKIVHIDAGGEFKGDTLKYLKNKGIGIRIAEAGRHRQQAIVERRNQIIAKALFLRMAGQELLTGKVSREWTEDLPLLIKVMNKFQKNKKMPPMKDTPICSGDTCNLLDVGTKVRVSLQSPRDAITGKPLHGRFRATDIRWDPKIRVIRDIILKPNYPPLYLLDGKKGEAKVQLIGYTKNQLQVIQEDEEFPDLSLIKGKQTTFIPQMILKKKKVRGKIFYLVRWAGFKAKDDTWEPSSTLKEDVPELVEEFERSLKR